MILRRWRAPRSAGRIGSAVPVDGHAHGPVLDRAPCRRSTPRLARRPRRSTVPLARLDRRVEVEDHPGVGRLLEVELLDLDLAVPCGRRPVDAVHGVARARTAGRPSRAGWSAACAGRGVAALDVRRWAGATSAAPRRAGRRPASRPDRPRPTPRRTRTGRRSGSERLDAEVTPAPSGVRTSHDRSWRPRSDSALPGSPPGSVVGL